MWSGTTNIIWFFPIFADCIFLSFFIFFARDFISVEGFDWQWHKRWVLRGLVAPVLVWTGLNFGPAALMPPLTWGIAKLRYGGHPWLSFIAQVSLAAQFIFCWWTVVTFGWYLTNLCRRAKNSEDIIIVLVFSVPFLALFVWVFSGLGLGGIGFVAFFWLCIVLPYSLSIASFAEAAPAYSRAIGKIKFGKYREAEMAIIAELEKCQNDFDGWMMLAELYAAQFHDLDEAERTIYDLCCEPTTTLPQVSIALHRLADWQLHYAGDPVAAKRALEDLCLRMPETHLANMARNRINQLPANKAELAKLHESRTIKIAEPVDYLSITSATVATSPENAAGGQTTADELVAKLNQDPNDVISREKLARIFAEQLGQPGIALEQFELLLGMPEQPEKKIAEWLGLKAACQTRLTGEDSARETLERLVHEFPQTPQAFDAQRRLSIMKAYSRRKNIVPSNLRMPQHDDD